MTCLLLSDLSLSLIYLFILLFTFFLFNYFYSSGYIHICLFYVLMSLSVYLPLFIWIYTYLFIVLFIFLSTHLSTSPTEHTIQLRKAYVNYLFTPTCLSPYLFDYLESDSLTQPAVEWYQIHTHEHKSWTAIKIKLK